LIGPAEEHLGRQILALFPTQRASDNNGLERKLPNSGWHIASTPFALDDEQLPFLNSKGHQEEHRRKNSESLGVEKPRR
jgi:hypothetical protein